MLIRWIAFRFLMVPFAGAQVFPESAPVASMAPLGIVARIAGVVSTFERPRPGSLPRYFVRTCSGWFVTPTRILTAGHCVSPNLSLGRRAPQEILRSIEIYSPVQSESVGTARTMWRRFQVNDDRAVLEFAPAAGFRLPWSDPVRRVVYREASEYFANAYLFFGSLDAQRHWTWMQSRQCAAWFDGSGRPFFWANRCPAEPMLSGAPLLARTPDGWLLLGLQVERAARPSYSGQSSVPLTVPTWPGPWMAPIY